MSRWRGAGSIRAGSHNIIEPLALGKPVIVGPEIWTIEYPAVEALAAGVARQIGQNELTSAFLEPHFADQVQIERFLAAHGGAVEKTLVTLEDWA